MHLVRLLVRKTASEKFNANKRANVQADERTHTNKRFADFMSGLKTTLRRLDMMRSKSYIKMQSYHHI